MGLHTQSQDVSQISQSVLNAAVHQPTLQSSISQTNTLLYNCKAVSNPVPKVVSHELSTAAFCIFLNLKKLKLEQQKITPANFKCSKAVIFPVAEGTQAASVSDFNHTPHEVIN